MICEQKTKSTMKITIDLEHSISIHEAVEMIDEFNNQPWCKKASVVSDCSTCRDNQLK